MRERSDLRSRTWRPLYTGEELVWVSKENRQVPALVRRLCSNYSGGDLTRALAYVPSIPKRATGGFESGVGVAYVLTATAPARGDAERQHRPAIAERPASCIADRENILIRVSSFNGSKQ